MWLAERELLLPIFFPREDVPALRGRIIAFKKIARRRNVIKQMLSKTN